MRKLWEGHKRHISFFRMNPKVIVANDMEELSVWKNYGETENIRVLRSFLFVDKTML